MNEILSLDEYSSIHKYDSWIYCPEVLWNNNDYRKAIMTRHLAAIGRQDIQSQRNSRIYGLYCHIFSLLVIFKLPKEVFSLGTLPDASQEGLLWQFKSYSNVALFHYNVPSEVTRATWEFAAFQDDPGCPKRKVHIYLQHGAYPVFNGYPKINETQEDFPSYFYVERTNLIHMTTISAYQPTDSTVFPGKFHLE